MSTTKIVLMFVAAGLFGWVVGSPRPSATADAEATLSDKLRAVAEGAGAILPKDMGEGVTMRSIRADGTTLVLAITGLPTWRPALTDDEMARVMAKTACQNTGFRSMVSEGADIRIDATSPAGEALPALLIKECV